MPRTIECTISGIDGGGYAWQNVFFLTTDDTSTDIPTTLQAANEEVNTNLIPKYQLAANPGTRFLDVASRVIDPAPSYTVHKPIDVTGSRGGTAQMGAVSGVIRFLAAASTKIGRIFVVGSQVADFVNDQIQAPYQSLLEDMGDVFFSWDGTVGPWQWKFQIYNKISHTGVNIAGYDIAHRPTTLNKRMRA